MKSALLISLVIACLLSSCSPAAFIPVEVENGKALGILPIQYGRISYQSVYKVNASREDIFRQVRRWSAFRSSRAINLAQSPSIRAVTPATPVALSDNLLGDVITTGVVEAIYASTKTVLPYVTYTVGIESYEGYYRVTLTNFYAHESYRPHYLEYRNKTTSAAVPRILFAYVDKQVGKILAELNDFVSSEVAKP